jgi:hypothetical protein
MHAVEVCVCVCVCVCVRVRVRAHVCVCAGGRDANATQGPHALERVERLDEISVDRRDARNHHRPRVSTKRILMIKHDGGQEKKRAAITIMMMLMVVVEAMNTNRNLFYGVRSAL